MRRWSWGFSPLRRYFVYQTVLNRQGLPPQASIRIRDLETCASVQQVALSTGSFDLGASLTGGLVLTGGEPMRASGRSVGRDLTDGANQRQSVHAANLRARQVFTVNAWDYSVTGGSGTRSGEGDILFSPCGDRVASRVLMQGGTGALRTSDRTFHSVQTRRHGALSAAQSLISAAGSNAVLAADRLHALGGTAPSWALPAWRIVT